MKICVMIVCVCVNTGYKTIIKLLIEKGANVNALENIYKMTPLHFIVLLDSSKPGHKDWTDNDYLSNSNLTCVSEKKFHT